MNIAVNLYSIAVCLILLMYLLMNDYKAEKSNRFFISMCLFNIAMILGDTTNWLFEEFGQPWYPFALKAGQVVYYASSSPLLFSFAGYLLDYHPVPIRHRKLFWRLAAVMCGIQLFFSVLSYWNGMYFFTDANNIYHRGSLFWLSQLIPGLILLADMVLIFICRKHISIRDIFFLSSYILFIFIAQTIQIFNYGIALTNVGVTISLLLIFTNIQSRRELRMEQQERELTRSKVAVMLSQIQPHFLYNSLVVIRHLCKIDPKAAEETVVEFSDYLRGNLDSLSLNEPIPFERELRHVQTYLKIEKKRFGDKLMINYDIKAMDFLIPALTLQPIVENAVRYGITKKEHGGTIEIKTEETEDSILITVTDDGAGFVINENPKDDERSHIGIDNARSRLAMMCNGTLDIQSKSGVGTIVVITIPNLR